MARPSRQPRTLAARIRSGFRAFWGSPYEGANITRYRSQNYYNSGDAKKAMTPWVRTQLLTRARYLYANLGLIKGAVRAKRLYSVGSGFRLQSQSVDRKWAEAFEQAWQEWDKIADICGRFSFNQLAGLASVGMDVDGDCGFILTQTPTGWPAVQFIPAHRITADGQKNEDTTDGVYLDPIGRPVAYRISVGDEDKYAKVAASSFIHLFDADRGDQIRGISALAHAVNGCQDIFEMLESEKMAVKINSRIALKNATEEGESDTGRDYLTTAPAATPDLVEETIENGEIRYFRPGEGLDAHTFDRPSPVFTGFLEYIARDASVGLNLPFEFLWKSDVGGTAQRMILQQSQRTFNDRADYLDMRLYTRTAGYCAGKWAKRGDIPPLPSDWWRMRWQRPAKISVDVGREARENRADMMLGIRTHATDAGERGEDWQEESDQVAAELTYKIERAQEVAKKTGVPFDFAWNQLRAAQGVNQTVLAEPEPSAPANPSRP